MAKGERAHGGQTPFAAFLASVGAQLAGLGDIRKTFRARPTSFRVNTLKADVPTVLESCKRAGIKVKRLPWSNAAFIVPEATKREVEALPEYESGAIYLQSLASQIPPIVLDPQPGERVLDLCAAPGGKTAQIAALMRGDGDLVAIEKDMIRFARMEFNLKRQGVERTEKLSVSLVRDDALELNFERKFDRVLVDAPCSGEARFIEDDRETWRHWKKEFVLELSALQRKLIGKAMQLLKPGGVLVYSTCTFSVEENELVVAEAIKQGLKSEPWPTKLSGAVAAIPAAVALGGKTYVAGHRLKPNSEIEGFFVARFRK
jgi:16S rRNA (cytosine1407-C5)-methyltransferase